MMVVMLAAVVLAGGCATVGEQGRSQAPPPSPSGLLTTSPVDPPQMQPSAPSTPPTVVPSFTPPRAPGSLWTAHTGSLYQDMKARNVGDVVTITVSETADASEEATTETKRSHDWSGKISGSDVVAGGKSLIGGPSSFDYGVEFGRGLKGSGKTSRTNSVKAYMTATVVEVLPNGNLVIRGSRWVKVNDELHQVVLEGVVRPVDISRNNTVLSQKIADAKIFVVGKGPVSRQQRPGWLSQMIDLLFPF